MHKFRSTHFEQEHTRAQTQKIIQTLSTTHKKTSPKNVKPKKLALDPLQHKIIHEQIRKIKPAHH